MIGVGDEGVTVMRVVAGVVLVVVVEGGRG